MMMPISTLAETTDGTTTTQHAKHYTTKSPIKLWGNFPPRLRSSLLLLWLPRSFRRVSSFFLNAKPRGTPNCRAGILGRFLPGSAESLSIPRAHCVDGKLLVILKAKYRLLLRSGCMQLKRPSPMLTRQGASCCICCTPVW